MKPQPVDLAKSYRLLNHGPTVLVSAAHNGVENLMAAAWSMPIDFSPPKVSVVIEESSLTRELVDASGTFALNVPTRALAKLTLQVGQISGRETIKTNGKNKFQEYGIGIFRGKNPELPLVDGCAAWLECRVIPEPHIQKTYDLFIGEIVAAWADPRVFSEGHWHLSTPELHTLHYIAGGMFFLASESLEVKT